MSFGFSTSDISMLAKLSYKLHGILGPDRESAPATLRELAKSLFGLQSTPWAISPPPFGQVSFVGNPTPAGQPRSTDLNIFAWTEVRDGRNEARGGMAKIEELLEKLVRHELDAKQTALGAGQVKGLVAWGLVWFVISCI